MLLNRSHGLSTENFLNSFNELPSDNIDYFNTGFKSRYRSFSLFSFDGKHLALTNQAHKSFNNKLSVHTKYYGKKKLANLSRASTACIMETLPRFLQSLPIDCTKYHVGVNQVRVRCSSKFPGATAPDFHQDGYNYSAHLCFVRENVDGGESKVASDSKGKNVEFKHVLQPREYIFFNDKNVWHTATKITPTDGTKESYRDMVIIDLTRKPTKKLAK